MKKMALFLLFCFVIAPTLLVSAQEEANFSLLVTVDSTFIRALPSREAENVASVFEGDVLEAIGRNVDGLWFDVSRPGRNTSLGWISREVVRYNFVVGSLPITNFTTGVTGSRAVIDTGVAALLLGEARLRDRPNGANTIATIPVNVTIPVISRSADNLWYEVNYLGQVGWVSEFLLRLTGNAGGLPATAASTSGVPAGGFPIIPPEIQRAQVQRFREYLIPMYDLSVGVANYWQTIRNGEIAPCNPPGNVPYYSYTEQDIVELPELRRYLRRMERAINDLNESITLYARCGIFTPNEISNGYSKAVNASVILDAILGSLDNLEENIIPD